jgi:hypothetical protein
MKEGRDPDRIFKVFVPDDAPFDKAAENHRNRGGWFFDPREEQETNCVYAVDAALNAGGVPVGTFKFPGYLGSKLEKMSKVKKAGQKWSVSPARLSDIPGRIR